LSRSSTPDKKSGLTLYQRGTEYSIRVNGQELMNSRMFGSEKILAELSCTPIADRHRTKILCKDSSGLFSMSLKKKSGAEHLKKVLFIPSG
jgi:hypothetical protein